MQEDGNIMDFYVNGDVAPGGRFNYIYNVTKTDDGYFHGSDPQGTNQGLKCELYMGSFDSIPQFNLLKVSEVHFVPTVQIPESTSTDFALNYRGFFEADAKDEFAFTLETDHLARLYINGMLVVESSSTEGEKTGTIKLMPGKHELQIKYVTGQTNSANLIVQVQSSTITQTLISGSMLSKYNLEPEVEFSFFYDQNYFSEIDTVATGTASDPDGNVIKIEIFNDQDIITESNSDEITLKDLTPGDYSVIANATDNDGAMTQSRALNFEVKPAFPVPGEIKVEEFRKGSGVVILEYPIAVGQQGTYLFTFNIRTSANPGAIMIKINGEERGRVDIPGQAAEWIELDTNVFLVEGIHILELDFEGRVVLGKLGISVSTEIENFEKSFLQVHPNPSSGDFLVQSAHAIESIRIYDVMGKMVNEIAVEKKQFTIRVGSAITPGIYLLQVNFTNKTKQVIRIVKN